MVNSFYDEQLDEGCAFEELISFHGGMGGPQTRPFILHPVELEAPDEPIIGAEAAYRVLAGWRRRLQGDAARGRRSAGGRRGRRRDGAGARRLRPRRLNTAIATLFMIGSFGFALGCDVVLRVGGRARPPTRSPSSSRRSSSPRRRSAARPEPDRRPWPRRGRRGTTSGGASASWPGCRTTRRWLARGHAVPRHAVLQRDDVLGHHHGGRPTASTTRWCGGRTSTARSCSSSRVSFAILASGPAPALAAARGRLVGRVAQHARVRSPSWRRRSAPS